MLLKIVKPKLTHIHLSGLNNFTNHSLLFTSENNNEIINFIKNNDLLSKNIILEGSISSNIEKDIKNEINFIYNLKINK